MNRKTQNVPLMQKLILLILIAPLLCCGQQFNPYTNAIDCVVVANVNSNEIVSSVALATKVTGIPCNPNTFWANDSATNIVEFELNGNIITSTGNSYPYVTRLPFVLV